jgi:hypothetical protein
LVVCAVFKSCTALRPYIAHLDDIYKDFNNYKFRVPVSGAIILNDTYERVICYFFLPILVHFYSLYNRYLLYSLYHVSAN